MDDGEHNDDPFDDDDEEDTTVARILYLHAAHRIFGAHLPPLPSAESEDEAELKEHARNAAGKERARNTPRRAHSSAESNDEMPDADGDGDASFLGIDDAGSVLVPKNRYRHRPSYRYRNAPHASTARPTDSWQRYLARLDLFRLQWSELRQLPPLRVSSASSSSSSSSAHGSGSGMLLHEIVTSVQHRRTVRRAFAALHALCAAHDTVRFFFSIHASSTAWFPLSTFLFCLVFEHFISFPFHQLAYEAVPGGLNELAFHISIGATGVETHVASLRISGARLALSVTAAGLGALRVHALLSASASSGSLSLSASAAAESDGLDFDERDDGMALGSSSSSVSSAALSSSFSSAPAPMSSSSSSSSSASEPLTARLAARLGTALGVSRTRAAESVAVPSVAAFAAAVRRMVAGVAAV
jgi:hypothetical protein